MHAYSGYSEHIDFTNKQAASVFRSRGVNSGKTQISLNKKSIYIYIFIMVSNIGEYGIWLACKHLKQFGSEKVKKSRALITQH